MRKSNIFVIIDWREYWQHIEILNFTWLDATQRVMQDDVKNVLVELSLKRAKGQKQKKL